MNLLNLLMQGLVQKADGQSFKASGTMGAEAGGSDVGGATGFDAVLRAMGEGDAAGSATGAVVSRPSLPGMARPLSSLAPVAPGEQASLESKGGADNAAGDEGAAPAVKEPAVDLLTGWPALRAIAAEAAPTPSLQGDQAESAGSGRPSLPTDSPERQAGFGKPTDGAVKVVMQETHFKPIAGTPYGHVSLKPSPEMPMAGEWAPPSGIRHDPVARLAVDRPVTSVTIPPGDPLKVLSRNAKEASDLPEGLSVSGTAIQRLAAAVTTELREASVAAPATSSDTGATAIASKIRASEPVVRLLSLQLHPLELGVVTVKMKLTGEQIEVEVVTSREETAEILRKDSDKLSSLLRTTGYRPEIVSILVSAPDAAQTDNSTSQRPTGSFQAQSQNDQSQPDARREPQGGDTRRGPHRQNLDRNGDESGGVHGGAGGVYL